MDELSSSESGCVDALSVDALSKMYADGTRALDALTLRVPAGSFFGLLGPNGAGKSTLLGAITGLVRIDAERVRVFGHDVVTDAENARLATGIAPQDIHLDRFLTVREVLVYHGRYFGMRRREATVRADELLDAFNLGDKAHVKPNRLSGGMRRRLIIARALSHRPRLLVLDEPTAGVDLKLRHELWDYLQQLQAERRVTVLLTTHYIEEAQALCDSIAMIHSGRIVAEGTPTELIERNGGGTLEDAYTAVIGSE